MDPSERLIQLAARVIKRREVLGFRRVELQRAAGLSDAVVRDVEKGVARPHSYQKLSLGLGWTPDSIDEFLSDGREPRDIQVEAASASGADAVILNQLAEEWRERRERAWKRTDRSVDERVGRIEGRLSDFEDIVDLVRDLELRVEDLEARR